MRGQPDSRRDGRRSHKRGSIDPIWINGENFRTLKDTGLLYGPWAWEVPNQVFVPWGDPAVDFDFGTAVGYESPWGRDQFVFEYNSDLVPVPPTTFESLERWIHVNPGLFTYPAIPDFTGSGFVRHIFYWIAGGPEPFFPPSGAFLRYVFELSLFCNTLRPSEGGPKKLIGYLLSPRFGADKNIGIDRFGCSARRSVIRDKAREDRSGPLNLP